MAYSRSLQLALLQETTDEMARNGCKKVLIVNGHGGNDSLLPYFAQTQLDKPHDYVVYVFDERTPDHGGPPKKTKIDMHAGESETSKMMISRPDTVHLDRATSESGADQARQKLPDDVYTGIWWYTRFPNHYSGDGSVATKELGEYQMKWWIDSVVKAIQRRESRRRQPQTCRKSSTKRARTRWTRSRRGLRLAQSRLLSLSRNLWSSYPPYFPISMPVMKTSTPPKPTCRAAETQGVSM